MDARPAPRAIAPARASWTAPFLREVAESLARGPPGAALCIERVGDGRGTLLVPSDAWVDSALVRAAARVPVELVLHEPLPADPPRGLDVRIGYLVPARDRPAGPSERREAEPARFERAAPSPPSTALPQGLSLPGAGEGGAWCASQTHWFASTEGALRVRCRYLVAAPSGEAETAAWAIGTQMVRRLAPPVRARLVVGRPSRRELREWSEGALRRARSAAPFQLGPDAVPPVGEWGDPSETGTVLVTDLHAVVIGASGSGKTALLAGEARRWIASGRPAVVLDLHGDLAPAIVGALAPPERTRTVAIDAASVDRIRGVALLGDGDGPGRDREVALVVSALRRVSSDGEETFWGPRLERIFDTFARAAQEEGGGLLGVHALLTDPRRREACRYSTRSAEVARFLDELPALLKRNPELLWPAAARTSKIALDPRLGRLLSPGEDRLDVGPTLAEGRSILWRLPLGELGPEGAQLAAGLLLAHAYLRRTSARGPAAAPLLLVLDEAHLFPAPLVAEILSEGRKFGVRALLATQYPERLPSVARNAAAGAVGTHVLFRVPPPAAAASGAWVGLQREEAVRLLPALPPGTAVLASAGASPIRRLVRLPAPAPSEGSAWEERVAASAPRAPSDPATASDSTALEEEVLLDVLSGRGSAAGPTEAEVLALRNADGAAPPVPLLPVLHALERRGWIANDGGRLSVTAAGLAGLGMAERTGAASESDEHRAILLHTFLILARRGARMQVVRQGRFDTRLPDGRVELLAPAARSDPPAGLAERVDRLRRTWAWRTFGGRDAHVEAEVSGAERPERIRRDVEKARAAGAFLILAVGDPVRARRVRATLGRLRVDRQDAQVWTLASARRRSGPA